MSKTVDNKNLAEDFYTNDLPESIKSQIYCHLPGKVTKYNKKDHTCVVQILPLQSDGNKRPTINEVIVPYSIWKNDEMMEQIFKIKKFVQKQMGKSVKEDDINSLHQDLADFLKPLLKEWKKDYIPLKVGSVVNVGFYDRDIDNFEGKSNYKLNSRRMHSLNDAYVESVVFNN